MPNPIKLYAKDILRWMYWGPIRLLVHYIPKGISYRFVAVVGLISFAMSGKKTDRLRQWLEKVAGKAVSKNQIIEVFVQYYRNSLDTLLYDELSVENIDQFVRYEGLENLNKGLENGKGVILLHPHFGNEEYLMPAMGHKGFSVSQIASRWEPDYLSSPLFALANRIRRHAWRMRINTRERLPVGFIYVDKGLRDIYRLLLHNEVLLLALDGREGTKWLELPFLGMKAKISSGPMKIARSTGATVLPTLITRTGLYSHTVHICSPINVSEQGDDRATTIREDTLAALEALEPHIKKHPAQYAKFIILDVTLFNEENFLS